MRSWWTNSFVLFIFIKQTYLKNREIATRDTSESTNTRVLWSSLFEALALAAVSVFQVYSIKRFFEVKRVI